MRNYSEDLADVRINSSPKSVEFYKELQRAGETRLAGEFYSSILKVGGVECDFDNMIDFMKSDSRFDYSSMIRVFLTTKRFYELNEIIKAPYGLSGEQKVAVTLYILRNFSGQGKKNNDERQGIVIAVQNKEAKTEALDFCTEWLSRLDRLQLP